MKYFITTLVLFLLIGCGANQSLQKQNLDMSSSKDSLNSGIQFVKDNSEEDSEW